jgi:hypothetical protein
MFSTRRCGDIPNKFAFRFHCKRQFDESRLWPRLIVATYCYSCLLNLQTESSITPDHSVWAGNRRQIAWGQCSLLAKNASLRLQSQFPA